MRTKNFNWGIIGPGRIAHKFAHALTAVNEAELYAVASRNKERRESFCGEYNVPNMYNTYEELANDPMIDAIYIATPHRFHFEQTKLCLEAGKPVLCEKPFTVNSKQSKMLINLAKEKNVFMMEALWTLFLPIYKVIRKWLDENEIGDIKILSSTFGISPVKDLNDRKFNHELAGGALLDLGIYQVSISQWILNDNPHSFSARAVLGETNVDEILAAILQYKNGIISEFNCNYLANTENHFFIYGTKGYIKIHSNYWGAEKATLYKDNEQITETRTFRASGFEYQTEEVMSCVKSGKLESDIMPTSQTQENLELMDKIRERVGLKYSFE